MKTIGLVPLDSRPCNTSWIQSFASISGVKLMMYPRSECGDLTKGASFKDEVSWIYDHVLEFDYLIVSCDALYFGGLIQARLGKTDLDLFNEYKDLFINIKKKNPKIKLYLFDTLMRTSITSDSKETAMYWDYMNQYSSLVGLVHFFGRQEDKEKLKAIEEKIPHQIIDNFLKARKLKHDINKFGVNNALNGAVDYLILLQEDSMPYGIQAIEGEELKKMIGNAQNISFFNGTDEGGALLFAKALADIDHNKYKVAIECSLEDSISRTMLFEDRPCNYNLKGMFKTIGLEESVLEDSDFILGIFNEEDNVDLNLLSTEEVNVSKNVKYYHFVNLCNKMINDFNICLVDLFFPNGGTNELLEDINIKALKGYYAWNTASNSLGTALAGMVSYCYGLRHGNSNVTKLNKKFLYERIIDDCLYQYIVRRIVNCEFNDQFNLYKLANNEEVEVILKRINELLPTYIKKMFGREIKYKISLPWNRTFECEVEVEI